MPIHRKVLAHTVLRAHGFGLGTMKAATRQKCEVLLRMYKVREPYLNKVVVSLVSANSRPYACPSSYFAIDAVWVSRTSTPLVLDEACVALVLRIR